MKRKLTFCALLLLFLVSVGASADQTITLHQIWDDAGNVDCLRPEALPVTVVVGSDTFSVTDGERITLPDGPVTFAHPFIPTGYEISYEGVTDGNAVIIYRHTPSVRKIISNELEAADLLIILNADPEDPFVTFYVSVSLPKPYPYITSTGVIGWTDQPIPLHAGETITVPDLPVGTPYSVFQTKDPRYSTSYVNRAGDIDLGENVVVINNVLNTTSFRITKLWQGEEKKITLHLYADGEEVQAVFRRSGGNEAPVASGSMTNSYTYTVDDLPRFTEAGHEIIYSAKEEYLADYVTIYVNVSPYADRIKSIYNGGTVINREVVSFSVRKIWEDEKKIHPNITFQLYQNGTAIAWQAPEKFGSIYTWKNLPKYKDGHIAVYSVTENPVAGYTARYENDGVPEQRAWNNGIVYNSPLPPTGDAENLLFYEIMFVLSTIGIVMLMKRKCKHS